MHTFQRVARLVGALDARSYSCAVVTARLSIWLRSRLAGIDCRLLRPATVGAHGSPIGKPALPDARRFDSSVRRALETLCQSLPVRGVAIWGSGPHDHVLKSFAKTRRLATLHFELGNVEPKTFLDPDGVNAAARLARCPDILDVYDVSDAEIAEWKVAFIQRKQAQLSIPQQRRLITINPWFLLDLVGIALLRTPQPAPLHLGSRLRTKVALWRRRLQPSLPAVLPRAPYVFLPLQVSTDSNLLVHSSHDNLAAIAFAAQRAAELGCDLVIKPHPAEHDTRLLARIFEMCRDRRYILSVANTAALIQGATEVITINSTVGLEARLMGKPVTILGRSLYERFTDRQAAVYAMRHLLPFVPFGTEPASIAVADRIIALVEQECQAAAEGVS